MLATVGVPAIVGFVSASGCELNGAVLECAVATLAAGESASFTARFSTTRSGTATVQGSVSADENDPDASSNSMSMSVTISDPPSSGGGCVYNPDGPSDWTLPAMLAFALLMLGMRRRTTA